MFTLLPVKLIKNGRDQYGMWHGIVPGLLLWAYFSHDGQHRGFFRSATRESAEGNLRAYYRSYFPDHLTFSRETK